MWSGFVELRPDENLNQPRSKVAIDVLLLEVHVVVYGDMESLCQTAGPIGMCRSDGECS